MNTIVLFTEISDTFDLCTDRFMGLVLDGKREQLEKYHFFIDRKLSLYGELLVRQQAIRVLGLNNNEIEFGINKYGKPYLRGASKFHYNISHTRNAVAVAFSHNEIGIDIEQTKKPDFKVAKRFFTSNEGNYVLSQKNAEHAFYEIWTKKEAYIKCIGTGLSTPLKSFDVLKGKINSMMRTFKIEKYLISVCCTDFLNAEPLIINMTEAEIQLLISQMVN